MAEWVDGQIGGVLKTTLFVAGWELGIIYGERDYVPLYHWYGFTPGGECVGSGSAEALPEAKRLLLGALLRRGWPSGVGAAIERELALVALGELPAAP